MISSTTAENDQLILFYWPILIYLTMDQSLGWILDDEDVSEEVEDLFQSEVGVWWVNW